MELFQAGSRFGSMHMTTCAGAGVAAVAAWLCGPKLVAQQLFEESPTGPELAAAASIFATLRLVVWGGAGPPALANGEVVGEKWDPLPLPGPRYGHCAAVLMSDVYLLGGVGGAREAFKWRQHWLRSGPRVSRDEFNEAAGHAGATH